MKMKYLLLGSSITTIFTGLASAAVTISQLNPIPYQTSALDEFQTSGGQMGGLEVTVYFFNPGDFSTSTQTATWVEADAVSGSATGTGFILSQGVANDNGSTFFNPWTLDNLSQSNIVGFNINGRPGDTVFDRTLPNTGTIGSDQGKDFAFTTNQPNGDPFNAMVTYYDSLRITGEAAVGDTFLQLEVLLTGQGAGDETPLEAGQSLSFMQDTDNALVEGDFTQVPEPSTGLGIGLLLSAAFFLRRRK